jgi:pimeloyl-ACP methyl ester carboxylesterase
MIYEPACVIPGAQGPNLSGDVVERAGETGPVLQQARQALQNGKPGKALGIFTQLAAGWPAFLANAAAELTARLPAYRPLIPCQIDDLEALERLWVRLDAYAKIQLPLAVVSGETSPATNLAMANAVAQSLPAVERFTLSKQGHGCHVRDPQQLARVIGDFAGKVFAKKDR